MKTNLLKYILSILIPVVAVSGIVYAGSLTPPGSVLNTMYTLDDIYNRASGTTATEGSGAIPSTPGSASATFHTLTEIYEVVDAMPLGKPLKTGQVTCHNANSSGTIIACGSNTDEQDGDSQRGVAFSYTDNGDETITDNNTDLMWQKCPIGLSGASCGTGSLTTATWNNATSTCASLSLGGYDDWHLPNVRELQSIVDFSVVPVTINSTYFPANTDGSYWTSTTVQGARESAYVIYFDGGATSYLDSNKPNLNAIRCLRQNS